MSNHTNVLFTSLVSGGFAGTFVDIALFPLDTLKTRLQSPSGFLASGGFRGLYNGIKPVILGSAPTAALFFVTYDSCKEYFIPKIDKELHFLVHMGAASIAEMVACLIRVPVEVTKQRKQALQMKREQLDLKLLYRGYWSTILRDLPFSLLQFPMWEYFKHCWKLKVRRDLKPWEGAICGALSGGIAAAATTPFDVAKTRIMLSEKTAGSSDLKISGMLRTVYKENGVRGLFAGFVPRIIWITAGGFIFFGVYEQTKYMTSKFLPTTTSPTSYGFSNAER